MKNEKQKELPDARFHAFKVSLCGNQIKRDYEANLTIEQARNKPFGTQTDNVGSYIWSYALMWEYS